MAPLPENNSNYRSDRAKIGLSVSDYHKEKMLDDQCLRTNDVNCWGEPEDLPLPLFHDSITKDWLESKNDKCDIHMNSLDTIFVCNKKEVFVLSRKTPI